MYNGGGGGGGSTMRVNCARPSNAIPMPILVRPSFSFTTPYSTVNLGSATDPWLGRSAAESSLQEDSLNFVTRASMPPSGRKQYIAKRLPTYGRATTSYPGIFVYGKEPVCRIIMTSEVE